MTANEKSYYIVKSTLQALLYAYGAFGLYRLFKYGGVKSDTELPKEVEEDPSLLIGDDELPDDEMMIEFKPINRVKGID